MFPWTGLALTLAFATAGRATFFVLAAEKLKTRAPALLGTSKKLKTRAPPFLGASKS